MSEELFAAQAKEIAEALALLAAGGFFIYKAITGYMRVNLSIYPQCKRQRADDGSKDHLVILLKVKKGPNGSVGIHDAGALVTYDGEQQKLSFSGIVRSSYKSIGLSNRKRVQVNWDEVSKTSPLLKLVPDEEVDLAAVCDVPTGAVCSVQTVIVGKKVGGWKFGQWKSSCISLPTKNKAPAA